MTGAAAAVAVQKPVVASRPSHQRGALGVLLVDLLTLPQQLLDVSEQSPLRGRPRLVDHLLGDP